MLDAKSKSLGRHVMKISSPIATIEALEGLRSDEGFRVQWISTLARAPFAAFFWEMPALTSISVTQPLEFVLTEARDLAEARPDVGAFQKHFTDGDVVVFDNLGRDATLVVPCPLAPPETYVHLAAFLRGAPAAQQHSLLRRVAEEVLGRISQTPLWLSTAGMGVYWLHVRLDSQPKYYRHAPYRRAP